MPPRRWPCCSRRSSRRRRARRDLQEHSAARGGGGNERGARHASSLISDALHRRRFTMRQAHDSPHPGTSDPITPTCSPTLSSSSDDDVPPPAAKARAHDGGPQSEGEIVIDGARFTATAVVVGGALCDTTTLLRGSLTSAADRTIVCAPSLPHAAHLFASEQEGGAAATSTP